MFSKIKKMFEDEGACCTTGACAAYIMCLKTLCSWFSPATICGICTTGIDTLCCGGEGIGKGILVPIFTQLIGL